MSNDSFTTIVNDFSTAGDKNFNNRLTPGHRRYRRMLAHRHRNWNQSVIRFHVIFADKSRVSLYICDGRTRVRVGESYSDVIMDEMASQITSLMIVYSTAYSGADQRKHQSPVSLASVWGIHRDW